MTDSESHIDPVSAKPEEVAREPISYPTNHVVSIFDAASRFRPWSLDL